jgi:Sulfotransferase family
MSDAELPTSHQKPKVVYVLGAHRSGSTILGVALGNCANVFFAGEVHSWLSRGGVPSFGGSEGARFWEAVSEDVADADELFDYETQLVLDRSSAIYRIHKWPARRKLRPRYRRITEDLYHGIAKEAGATHVVDTSHYPLRARELQALGGIDLYLLYLVRDPQGVVASHDPRDTTTHSKPALTTNVHLWVTNLLSMLVFLRQPRGRRLFVRHEDFLADPEGVLRQILDCVECRTPIPDLTSLRIGWPLQGNHFLGKSEVIALRRGPAPPARPSRMTAVLQLPWRPVLSRLRPSVSVPVPEERAAEPSPGPHGPRVASARAGTRRCSGDS